MHYIRSTKEAAIQVASHGLQKGKLLERSPNWFNCRENDDAYNAFYILVDIIIHILKMSLKYHITEIARKSN